MTKCPACGQTIRPKKKLAARDCVECGELFRPLRRSNAILCGRARCAKRHSRAIKKDLSTWFLIYDNPKRK
jgi:hypothetical protein